MSLDRARELAEQLTNVGVRAVTSARSVVPPCVLVTPPVRTYDLSCGYSAAWQLYAIAPGGGDEGSWAELDKLVDQLATTLDVETVNPTAWKPSQDAPEAYPAFLVVFTEAVDPGA